MYNNLNNFRITHVLIIGSIDPSTISTNSTAALQLLVSAASVGKTETHGVGYGSHKVTNLYLLYGLTT